MEPSMIVRPMGFDLAQPYGPSGEWIGKNWVLKVSPKTVEYECPGSAGYDCRIAFTPLQDNGDSVHVFAFRVSGLIYDYGWNAVRLHFVQDKHSVHIDSQKWATDETCTLTCGVESNKEAHVYVESGTNPDPLPRLDERSKPLLKDDAGVVYRETIALDPKGSTPSVRLSVMQKNCVSIVQPWTTRAYKEFVCGKVGVGFVYA